MQEETDGEGSATGDMAAYIEAVEAAGGDAMGFVMLILLLGFSKKEPKSAKSGRSKRKWEMLVLKYQGNCLKWWYPVAWLQV